MTTEVPELLILAWTGSPVSSWQSTEDEYTIHAAPSSPLAVWTLCDEPVATPVGWASKETEGRAIVIPFMSAVTNPPPHIDGGVWHICQICLEEYLLNN